ncbi:MAG: YihY/virulence factor BrkB family protein [Verrucomicrobia bacterium]|nr:YihY/virulence factor BrkB family protein [Verrucomicrobiota bacterium]
MLKRAWAFLLDHFKKGGRIVVLSLRGFHRDDCYTKASVLSLYTLQFIVPFLALLFGIAKGFGFMEYLEGLISRTFQEEKEVVVNIITFALQILNQSSEEVIVGIGIIFLIWANIGLLSFTEQTLNAIWKIHTERPFIRKIADYLAIIILCPLVFIASCSMTVYVNSVIVNMQKYPIYTIIQEGINFLITISPFILSCLLLFLIYLLIPYARFRVWPRILSAVIFGIILQLWQILFLQFQIQIFNNSVVYGAFTLIPVLLIWLQISWMIILVGAELAASIENVYFYEVAEAQEKIKNISQFELGCLILYHFFEAFYTEGLPLSADQIGKHLRIPIDVTKQHLDLFVKGNILTPVEIKGGVLGYLSTKDPKTYTLKTIIDIMTENMHQKIKVEDSQTLRKICTVLNHMDKELESSQANIKLVDLMTVPE